MLPESSLMRLMLKLPHLARLPWLPGLPRWRATWLPSSPATELPRLPWLPRLRPWLPGLGSSSNELEELGALLALLGLPRIRARKSVLGIPWDACSDAMPGTPSEYS